MVLASAAPAPAELKLPAIFSDHMVLQRDLPVPVWGWADPGEEVTVSIAGQSVGAKAGTDGKWKLSLNPLKAVESTELVVKGNAKTLSVKDVAVGEVWLASGQSNMVVGIGQNKEDLEKVLPFANDPSLRICSLDRKGSYVLEEDTAAKWIVSSKDVRINNLSAVGYSFASHLRRALKVPVGVIIAAVGGVPGIQYLSPEAIAASSDPGLKLCAEQYQKDRAAYIHWKTGIEPVEMPKYLAAKAEAQKNKTPLPRMPEPQIPSTPITSSTLYHGQLGPIQPYAIRGALWYQGENASGPNDYWNLLDALVSDWRTRFNNPDLALLVVQITAQKPAFREKQLQFWQATPRTGLAVVNDTCTADEMLHVRYKETAGRRLSVIARTIVYGEKIEYSGPVYQSVKFDGPKAVVSFTHLGDGLAAKVPVDPTKTLLTEADLGGDLTAKGGELKGFALAGEDKKFVPAKAEIVGDTVVVSSDQVAKPVAVRYLWCEWPELWTGTTLYNKNGLPAPPFRSDSWIR
jgi:sialate O-acetylesterase